MTPYFRIGKGVALRVLRSQKQSLSLLCDITVELKDIVKQYRHCVFACYGEEDSHSANNARYKLWMKKLARTSPVLPSSSFYPQQMKPFVRMWPGLTSRLQSGGTLWSQSHQRLTQQPMGGLWRMDLLLQSFFLPTLHCLLMLCSRPSAVPAREESHATHTDAVAAVPA